MRHNALLGVGPVALVASLLAGCSACPHRAAPTPMTKRAAAPPRATVATASPSSRLPSPESDDVEADGDLGGDENEGEELSEDAGAFSAVQEAEWSWVKTRFPEVAAVRRQDDDLVTRLMDWAKPGETITIFDPACRPARVKRHGRVLRGLVHRGFQYLPDAPDEMSESISEIHLDSRFHEFPSNYTTYERDRRHRWVVSGAGGGGDFRTVGHLLSAVTTDAACFDNAAIQLRIACTRLVEEEQRCVSGGRRACDRCEGWGPHRTSLESGVGFSRVTARRRSKLKLSVDCNVPCRTVEDPPDVARANAALKDLTFVESLGHEPKPLIFRTEAACREYVKRHPRARTDADTWRGEGGPDE